MKDGLEAAGVKEKRRRLEPHDKRSKLRPFVRATKITDIALYWLPVAECPMRTLERRWLLTFLQRLKSKVTNENNLRLETFLQFKALYPDLLDRFLSRAHEYQPMTGLLLKPGSKPPALPALEDIEAEVKKGGPVNVNQWMADYSYWFVAKQDARQREDFLGFGGMIFLFLPHDPTTKPPDLKIPKIMRTHPALKDVDVDGRMAIAYSLQDKFLKQSKEVFGELMKDDPAYPGIPYVLPLLKSEDFFAATLDQRDQWFQVFDIYCIESKADKGVLLASKDVNFDDTLIGLIKELREEGLEYPS